MTRTSLRTALLCFCTLLTLTACKQSKETLPTSTAVVQQVQQAQSTATLTTQQMASDEVERQFVDRLHSKGLSVEPGNSVGQPFLRVSGTILDLRSGPLAQPAEIQSYAYKDSAIATADAQRVAPDGGGAKWIEPDGQGRGVAVSWVAPPHFFRQDRVVVIYVGRDDVVVTLLTELLGPQFAGR